MRTSTKVIPIEQAICDKKYYPRKYVDWVTIARYKGAMKTGAEFPDVVVALFKKKLIVVDGFHRLEAMRQLKKTHVQATILKGLNEKQIYVESVNRNMNHGRQFSGIERLQIIINLKNWKMSMEQISDIVRIPVENIEPYLVKRTRRISDNGGSMAILKPSVKTGGSFSITRGQAEEQDDIGGGQQLRIIEGFYALLKNDWLDMDRPAIADIVKKVKKLLDKKKYS